MIRGLIYGINNIFLIFYILIISRFLLSWIRRVDWSRQPFKFIWLSTEPYLAIFRRFIPPIGIIDISAMVAFIALQVIHNLLIIILAQFA